MIYVKHYIGMFWTLYHTVYRGIIGTGHLLALRRAVIGAAESTREMHEVRSWMRKEGCDGP